MSAIRSTLFLLILLALACAGCSGGAEDPATAEPQPPPIESEQPAVLAEDSIAPAFALVDLQGNDVRLADSTGQVRLIDFWATFCAPCRKEVPMMNALQQRYGDQGFQILAIADSVDEESAVRGFVEELEVVYPNLLGTDEVSASYGVEVLPTAYLLDGEGRIVKSYIGAKSEEELEAEIRRLLGLAPTT